jgi:hypothetical protein
MLNARSERRLAVMVAARLLHSELYLGHAYINALLEHEGDGPEETDVWPDMPYPDIAVWQEHRVALARALRPAYWQWIENAFLRLNALEVRRRAALPPSGVAEYDPSIMFEALRILERAGFTRLEWLQWKHPFWFPWGWRGSPSR